MSSAMQPLKPGQIVVVWTGRTSATAHDSWARSTNALWRDVGAVLDKQKGFLGAKALWNIENNGEVLMLVYWDALQEPTVHEKTPADTLLQGVNPILHSPMSHTKYEIFRARGAALNAFKPGHIVAILTAKSQASTRSAFDQDMEQAWGKKPSRPGSIGAQAVWSAEGACEARLIGYWESLDLRLSYERTLAPRVRSKFEAVMNPPFPRPKYVIVSSA